MIADVGGKQMMTPTDDQLTAAFDKGITTIRDHGALLIGTTPGAP